MIALLKTAERTHTQTFSNNYVYQQHVFAYKAVPLNAIKNKNVLEVGCGAGYGLQMIASPAASYVAIDKRKPVGVSFHDQISFSRCQLPMLKKIGDDQFDTVICFQVIEHIQNDLRLLSEIKRVLKPGGILYLTTPNRLTSFTRNPFHVREYLPDEMIHLINLFFDEATVSGVFGNAFVQEYRNENKKSVDSILRYDLLDLQHRLPGFLLRGVYSLANNLNRRYLAQRIPHITAEIRYHDFQIGELQPHCIDFFVKAIK